MPDLRLKVLYPRIKAAWSTHYHWPLWRDEPADEYVLRQVHVCGTNQSEFGHQNGLLADFLNVSELTNALNAEKPPDDGLNRLELFLTEAGFPEARDRIDPCVTFEISDLPAPRTRRARSIRQPCGAADSRRCHS